MINLSYKNKMGNRPGLIIGIIVIIVIIIVVVIIILQFQSARRAAEQENKDIVTGATCGASLYQSSDPIVCDFATGKEVRTKRATANPNCPSSQEFTNANCDCGNICKASKTCVGSNSTTVYTVDSGKPCNAACSAGPVILQDDPTCGVLGCDINCTTTLGICSPDVGKQLISVIDKVGVPNAVCPVVCKVTSIDNPNCSGIGCVPNCNNPAGEIGSHDPNTGALICVDKSLLGIPNNCASAFVQSFVGGVQMKVKLTTVAKGRLNPPRFLARVFLDQGGTFANRHVAFATETESTDNLWILEVNQTNFRNAIRLASDPEWIVAHNGQGQGFFGLNSGWNFQFAGFVSFPFTSEGATIFIGGASNVIMGSHPASNNLFFYPSNAIPAGITADHITWYTISPI
jgi:hypothetical protein